MLWEVSEFAVLLLNRSGLASSLASQAHAAPNTTRNKSPILPSMVPITKHFFFKWQLASGKRKKSIKVSGLWYSKHLLNEIRIDWRESNKYDLLRHLYKYIPLWFLAQRWTHRSRNIYSDTVHFYDVKLLNLLMYFKSYMTQFLIELIWSSQKTCNSVHAPPRKENLVEKILSAMLNH